MTPVSDIERALMRVFREMPDACVSLNIWRDRANCWLTVDSKQEDISAGDHEGLTADEALMGALRAARRVRSNA